MSGNSTTPFLSVVIPAYNEEHRLGPTLARIEQYLSAQGYAFEVLVVDNASKDRTAEVAREAGVEVIAEPRRGKGAAVKTGMLAARGEYVLFSDADLSTPIEEVEKLLAELRAGADVAIASRGLPESNLVKRQPWYREFVGRAGNVLVRMMVVRGIADTQCGFKLFPREIARRVFPAQRLTGAAFDVEILFIAQRAGWKIAEVPVTWIDSPDTRFSRVRDSLDALKDLFRIRLNWLLGRYRV
ncbi:MAG TPA: dolichyl-phosphate beta-glucosyltransferase [Armatimonadota bacterium]|nr:dolichyl-phosphate beta-glucosyltransferase [Armatimonadota bacterium]